MKLQPVDSSQLAAVGYDPASKILTIQFKGKKATTYEYQNVTQELYDGLLNAESVGTYFGQNVKSAPEKYPYKKIS